MARLVSCKKVCLTSFLFLTLLSHHAFAQFSNRLKDGGLKTYLSPDSATYLKLNFVSQVWVRYNESNPGSAVNGEAANSTFDVGLRRVRFVLTGQLSDRVFIFIQFGQNNFSTLSPRKTGAFFHDVTAEYAIAKKKLSLGFGLHGWNGLGRYSNSSISTILALDPPIFQETTNDVNDQFVRKLGMYAKGKLGKLDYRLSASTPFVTQTASTSVDPLSTNASYSMKIPKETFQGYFMYQFLDQESNAGAGTVGTYLGTKRVFNIGAGFVYQDKAMWSKNISNDTLYHAMGLWAVDFFWDTPLNKSLGTALTVYGGYFNYDFGKGYLRNVGPMNPANGVTAKGSFNGPGNAAPLIGTGDTFYLQGAYKFKKNLLGEEFGTLQVYSAVQTSHYNRLKGPMLVIDAGVNWLMHGHNSKFTLNYQSRPVFMPDGNDNVLLPTRRGEWVLQYQVAF
jgi:hypothetical protein